MSVHPVIMAGGSGTRFWPASRALVPKQFLKVLGPKALIEMTLDRVAPLGGDAPLLIVGNVEHRLLLEEVSKGRNVVTLEEPVGRNTAAAAGLAAIHLRKREAAGEPMVILPADHYISDDRKFRSLVVQGAELARQGFLVTFGVVPTRPETGYGYLRRGSVLEGQTGSGAYLLQGFVEKPSQPDAQTFVASGEYFWNSGIFVCTPGVLLEELQRHLPQVYQGLEEIEGAIGTEAYPAVLRAAYERFPSISLDYGVMEKTGRRIAALPVDFEWSDVGSWESLYQLRCSEADSRGNVVEGNAVLMDTDSCFVFNLADRMVASLGVHDLVIVAVKDAILVADIKESQNLKKLCEELKARGLTSLL